MNSGSNIRGNLRANEIKKAFRDNLCCESRSP
jgi:hypothetical protein